MALAGFIQKGKVETTSTGLAEANFDVSVAERHLSSAALILEVDPAGSYQLAYDAARKALQGILALHGFRVTSIGGHYTFVQISELPIFKPAIWDALRDMRRIRNLVEYPHESTQAFTETELRDALESATAMVEDAHQIITASL